MKKTALFFCDQDGSGGGCRRCYPGSCNYLEEERAGWCQLHSLVSTATFLAKTSPIARILCGELENKDIWTWTHK